MSLPAHEILDVIKRSDRVYQAVRGAVAERHLEKLLEQLKSDGRIDDFRFTNKEGEPDFTVSIGPHTWRVECKNVLRGKTGRYKSGELKVDFQKTRNQLGDGARTGRYYKASSFEVLAACEYNQTGRWEFKFVRTRDLPRVHVEGIDCLVKAVRVPQGDAMGRWTRHITAVLAPEDARRGP